MITPSPPDIHDKIKPLGELVDEVARLKSAGSRVVHSHGLFDLVHPGHVRHLAAAKCAGDILAVTLVPDRDVVKGPHRLAFSEQLRAESLAALQYVDFVAIGESASAAAMIRQLKPNIYVQGHDAASHTVLASDAANEVEAAAHAVGGHVQRTNEIQFSSSELLNSFLPVYPPHIHEYLRCLGQSYRLDDLVKMVDSLKNLRVMVVGEAILDEYVYGDVLGKSSKEPILAMHYASQETHAGGSVVIANHLAQFCDSVQLVTYLGDTNSQEDFIREHLQPNVEPTFVLKPNSPTIVKRRFVENYQVTKLLEVYEMNDAPLPAETDRLLLGQLAEQLPACDAVVAADYGHGLITPATVEFLDRQAPFLSVNTQINAANNGFHTLSKYPRADYVCVHEGEIRLDQRDQETAIRDLVERVANRMTAQSLMVTRGKYGTLIYSPEQGFVESPGLAVKVVDRVGAGDSVLAISSLCAAQGLPLDVTGFLANMVGAQAVTIVGNRTSISRDQLIQGIESVLK